MPRNNRRLQNANAGINPDRQISTAGVSTSRPETSLEPPPQPPQTSPSPPSKPNPRFLSLLLQALIMAFVISLFFVFVGVAAIIFIHLCIAGGALHRRRHHRRQQHHHQPISETSPSGCSQEELKSLPKSRFKGSEICPICLDNLSEGEFCRVLPICKHVFHLNCVDQWLSKVPACPVCRCSLRSKPETEVKAAGGFDWEQLWSAYG